MRFCEKYNLLFFIERCHWRKNCRRYRLHAGILQQDMFLRDWRRNVLLQGDVLHGSEVFLRIILTTGRCFICRYSRIPITATNAPEEQDFDQFISAIKDIPQLFDSNSSAPLPAMVFNCHVGQGRTTTGMVIGCLIMSHRTGFPSESQ